MGKNYQLNSTLQKKYSHGKGFRDEIAKIAENCQKLQKGMCGDSLRGKANSGEISVMTCHNHWRQISLPQKCPAAAKSNEKKNCE